MSGSASPDALLFYAHAVLCLLLAVGISWQSWRFARGWRRVGRCLAGWVAAAALWLSAYPPQPARSPARSSAALLLTTGYSPDTVRALRRQLGAVPILRYQPAVRPGGDTLGLASLADLPVRFPGLRHLHVLGVGVPVADLAALPASVAVLAHAGPARPGFVSGQWNRQLTLGDPLHLSGAFTPAGNGAVWIRLLANGAPRDSVRLPTGKGSFTLRYRPRHPGRLLARLEARQGRTVLATEPVPVTVKPARRLRVLMLASSPSFELNLLKNHLAERGHQVTMRLDISRGLVQTLAPSRPTTDLRRLTPALLAAVDVLIADPDALTALSPAEAQVLGQAATNGLGLVLTGADALPRTLPSRPDFALQALATAAAERPQVIRWPAGQAAIALPATLRPTPRTRLLVTAPAAGAAATRRVGWGRVVVATPTSTFQWLLSGATATYDGYWSTLLGAAARPLEPAARWQHPQWPRPDEPQLLQLAGSGLPRATTWVSDLVSAPVSLPLRQHPLRPGTWQATYWPAVAGWHRVMAPGQDSTDFYVFEAGAWQLPLRAQRMAALLPTPRASLQPAANKRSPDWPGAGWYFALFVLAAGALWLDDKR
jgi:hypothetical protein